ncbi:MAG TPA: diaminopimelate epimerase [Clostridia bacterium]|nr:diaminopimelate epimerase [Clostridia bacterium]
MRFTKMHGTGNDFVVIEDIDGSIPEEEFSGLANRLCDRRFGIGADGLILVLPSREADFKMRIFNADGSEAEMCGNGIRCFAKYLRSEGLTDKKSLNIETKAGLIKPEIVSDGKLGALVKVDMGSPKLEREEIPMIGKPGKVINELININGLEFRVTCVSMGNPHCVIFVDDLDSIPLTSLGPQIENSPLFPARTNVEFVQILGRNELKMRVWERGAGETLACGTGACASAVAAFLNKKTGRKVTVHLPGGDLLVEWADDDRVFMTGPAVMVFSGYLYS